MSNKIKCSHILVKKQNEAITVLDRIKNGEKFGKIAKELSLDSGSAKRDGNLGYFSKGKIVKEFEKSLNLIKNYIKQNKSKKLQKIFLRTKIIRKLIEKEKQE